MCNEASEQGPGALEYQKHGAVDQVMPLGASTREGWNRAGDTVILKWRGRKLRLLRGCALIALFITRIAL